jgi:hypothetical protein
MKTSPSLKSDLTYISCLTRAVLDGITSAPGGTNGWTSVPISTTAVWTPTAVGAAIGLLTAGLSGRHKPGYKVAAGGLVGSAVGFGAAMAWISRGATRAVARTTIQKVNKVRDARWLELNPINYA